MRFTNGDLLDRRLDCEGVAFRDRIRASVARSLGQDAEAAEVGATHTDPVELGSAEVHAGSLGPNDRVEIEALFGFDASAAVRDLSIEVNGTEIWQNTPGATAASRQVAIALTNRNSTASQIQTTPGAVGLVTPISRTFDTDKDGLAISVLGTVALEAPITVTDLTRDGNGIVTATATAHGLVAGDHIDVTTDPADNFAATGAEVLSAPDADSFTYLAAGSAGASTATTITAERYPVVTLESLAVKLVPGG